MLAVAYNAFGLLFFVRLTHLICWPSIALLTLSRQDVPTRHQLAYALAPTSLVLQLRLIPHLLSKTYPKCGTHISKPRMPRTWRSVAVRLRTKAACWVLLLLSCTDRVDPLLEVTPIALCTLSRITRPSLLLLAALLRLHLQL